MSEDKDIVERLCDLVEQATTERSHHYAGKCARDAIAAIEALRAELERERMRLAACGVVAMANTPDSAESARQMHDDYRSASCDEVANAVDREMALRAERDAALALLREARDWVDAGYGFNTEPLENFLARIDVALDAKESK